MLLLSSSSGCPGENTTKSWQSQTQGLLGQGRGKGAHHTNPLGHAQLLGQGQSAGREGTKAKSHKELSLHGICFHVFPERFSSFLTLEE
jgi:hypothetical protein